MGRQRSLSDVQLEEVLASYRKGIKSEKLAITYNVSIRTIHRALLRGGATLERGRPKGVFSSALHRYANGTESPLPRSAKKIAERVGTSRAAIKSDFLRRRRRLVQLAQNIDFKNTQWKYVDIRNKIIPAAAIESYTLQAETFADAIRLTCTLKGKAGQRTIRLSRGLIAHLSPKA